MITTESDCRINGLHITEVKAEVPVEGGLPCMTATYATLEALAEKPGLPARLAHTHGRCNAFPGNWSKETIDLLAELLKSMEEDLLSQHFKMGAGLEGTDATKRTESGKLEEADQV